MANDPKSPQDRSTPGTPPRDQQGGADKADSETKWPPSGIPKDFDWIKKSEDP